MSAKDHKRQSLSLPLQPNLHGKLAQSFRRLPSYHSSKQILISPAPILAQLRINALLDGKELIMPGPGLEKGFYRIKPFSIPFNDLIVGTSYKALSRYGKIIPYEELSKLSIDCLVTDALAVDGHGTVLGDGHGHFDLQYAILDHYQALGESPALFAMVDDARRVVQEELPRELWDVPVHGVMCPDDFVEFGDTSITSEIYWDNLPLKRIRMISLLWRIYSESKSF